MFRLGFTVLGLRFRVQSAGCRVQGAECRVQGAGYRVQGAGCRVQGAECRVQGPGVESGVGASEGGRLASRSNFPSARCARKLRGSSVTAWIGSRVCLLVPFTSAAYRFTSKFTNLTYGSA